MDRENGSFILPNRPSHLANNVSLLESNFSDYRLIRSRICYSIEKSISLYLLEEFQVKFILLEKMDWLRKFASL